ncbi:MAG: tetratricopeptide repeat protein [Desulfovibrio sp.]|jgi:TolA-binding protein|nr:tetratricopeptide repeat protein [Desulfovibrio sp.]
MRHLLAGLLRILCAALLPGLLVPAPGLAAVLRWEGLPDRERVTIAMDSPEGIAGPVARIDLHGVLIPFTQVPSGLERQTAPPEAKIFLGTRQLGRSLVLTTKTPEFGFMVASRTPTELAVDFFPNALGARWKPPGPSPVTEIPPDVGLQPLEPANAADAALQVDPAGAANAVPPRVMREMGADPSVARNATAAGSPGPDSPLPSAQPVTPPDPPSVPTALQAPPAAAAAPVPATDQGAIPEARQAPQAAAAAPAPAAGRTTISAAAQTQGPTLETRPSLAPESDPPGPLAANASERRPFLDSRRETDPRAAPLPNLAPVPPETASAPAATPGDASPPPRPDTVSPLGREHIAAPGESGVLRPLSPASTPQAAPSTPSPAAPPAAASSALTAGVQPAAGAGPVHDGIINLGGPGEAPAGKKPAEEAAPAEPAGGESHPGEGKTPPAAAESRGGEAQEQAVVYEDEQGNPVEPPLDPAQALPEIRKDMDAGNFAAALAKGEKLLGQTDLTPDQREEVLHIREEALFALNQDKLAENYRLISDAANQAISFNRQSHRNAGTLLRLGYMNLKLNNIPEARAQFNMLRRQFPENENVPLTYYYWGDYFFNRDELPKAADEFQYVLQHYPNSRYAREAALGLARSFYRMGYYQESFDVVEYIELRWQRFYLDYPPFLNMMGDVAFRLNKLDTALKHYWTYVNIEPGGEEADVILTRIGDIYGLMGETGAARELYEESIQRFPGKDGALVSMMRLAEEGINDVPSLRDMFPVFDRRFTMAPVDVYRTIAEKHADSALAPLAELKLAMWYLWKKDYLNALETCADFLKKYPGDELAPKIKEVGMQTFAVLSTESVLDNRYGRMREIWERYPFVRDQQAEMPPESRIALAVSYRDSNRPDDALAAVEPFFLGHKVPEYSEMALSLVLGIYLNYEQWDAIRQVARQIALWELTPDARRSLDFALALAAENLDEPAVAGPLWKKLYESGLLSAHEQALAAFFLARAAERDQELERAYLLGKEALSRLLAEAEKDAATADYGKIQAQTGSLMDVTETAGRLREALEFAQQYLSFLAEDNPARAGVLYRMARIYKRQGDEEAWRRQLTEIAQKYPGDTYGKTAAAELNSAGILDNASRYSPTGSL